MCKTHGEAAENSLRVGCRSPKRAVDNGSKSSVGGQEAMGSGGGAREGKGGGGRERNDSDGAVAFL
jgi:hypothetical protein